MVSTVEFFKLVANNLLNQVVCLEIHISSCFIHDDDLLWITTSRGSVEKQHRSFNCGCDHFLVKVFGRFQEDVVKQEV